MSITKTTNSTHPQTMARSSRRNPLSAPGGNVPEALVDWPFRCGRRCHRLPPLWSFPTSPISLFPLMALRSVAIRDAVESFQVGGENEYLVKICMSRPVSYWQVLDFKRRQLIDAKPSYAAPKLPDHLGWHPATTADVDAVRPAKDDKGPMEPEFQGSVFVAHSKVTTLRYFCMGYCHPRFRRLVDSGMCCIMGFG